MKQHIDTAPIWESYRQDCECPLCLLFSRTEAGNVDYFLGESVMEPSQRIEVNQKGFCARHFKQMYDAGNRLGLALLTQTYMRQTVKQLQGNAEKAREAAASEAGKSILRRIGSKGGGALEEIAAELGKRLPRYMIPNEYRPMKALPHNANGKIDRAALKRNFGL